MNRELKFRVWDNVQKRWWCEDSLYLQIDGKHIHPAPWATLDCELPNNDIVIQQYTGLKDSNGKDIYEGDILKTNYGLTLEIVYSQRHSAFMCKRSDISGESLRYCYDALYLGCHEVIGNIFENSELLKS